MCIPIVQRIGSIYRGSTQQPTGLSSFRQNGKKDTRSIATSSRTSPVNQGTVSILRMFTRGWNSLPWTDDIVEELIMGFCWRGLEDERLFIMYVLQPLITWLVVKEIMLLGFWDIGLLQWIILTTTAIGFRLWCIILEWKIPPNAKLTEISILSPFRRLSWISWFTQTRSYRRLKLTSLPVSPGIMNTLSLCSVRSMKPCAFFCWVRAAVNGRSIMDGTFGYTNSIKTCWGRQLPNTHQLHCYDIDPASGTQL